MASGEGSARNMIWLKLKYLLVGTLRRQLVAGMVLVVTLMMSLFVWDIARRHQALVIEQQSEQALALARSVATASTVWVASRDLSGIEEIVNGFAAYPGLRYAMVLDQRGQVLAHTEPERLGQFMHDLPTQISARALPRGDTTVDVVSPVLLAGKPIGWARIGLSRESQQATLTRVARSALIYAVLAILLSTLLAWFTGRYMTRRLHAIQHVADAMQSGASGLRANVPGSDEAAQLARQFNTMLDTVALREAALADALRRLHAITNRVPGVVMLQWLRSSNGSISVPYASEALRDLFHLSPEQVTEDATALLATFHPNDLPRLLAAMQESGQRLTPWLGESRLQFVDEPDTWVQLNAMPQPDFDGAVRWYGFIIDITEIKRAHSALHSSQEHLRTVVAQLETRNTELKLLNDKLVQSQWQLVHSEKMASIGQLAAGVAHEINNPIGFVQSNLGSLERYVGQLMQVLASYQEIERLLFLSDYDAQAGDWLARIKKMKSETELDYLMEDIPVLLQETRDGVVRVRQIVNNLKDFSCLDKQEQWEWADLRAGLESTLSIVHNEIKYRANVVKDYGYLPNIKCLPSQLNQVFLNLLMNAAQAMPEGSFGTITVRCGADAAGVWVEVADTGGGIAPEHLSHIFEPFFTTKPVGKGTGLGLSLSFGIVQKHGGHIDVTSALGVGTTFRVWLPLEPPGSVPDD